MRRPLTDAVDGWAARHADRPPDRNPKAIVLLVALGSNLFPTAIGIADTPGITPTITQQVSAVLIVLGCIGCVGGMLLPRPRLLDLGVQIEIAGCIILAFGCFGLAFALGDVLLTPLRATITVGLGCGCIARAGQIALYARGRRLRNAGADCG